MPTLPKAFGDELNKATWEEISAAMILERKLKHLAKLQEKYEDCQSELDTLVAKVKARNTEPPVE